MASDDRTRPPGFRPPEHDETSRDVRRRLVVEAAPDAVWRALSDPTELAAWWGEGTRLDVTPGGEGRLVEEGEPVRLARVVEVRPGQRLMLDWWPEDPTVDEPATRVTIDLVPCPFGTIVHVLECALLDLSGLLGSALAGGSADRSGTPSHPALIPQSGRPLPRRRPLGRGLGGRALALR